MYNPQISIIVPVYKVEPYLNKCVDSILNQTYRNLEVILVDDGSPDRCGAICDEYAARDQRVKVIHKKNGGLSSARNAGLDVMTGAYIGFVDSDDWIEPGMYEKLLGNLQKFEADLSFGAVADDLEENGTVRTVKVSDYGVYDFAESNVDAMKRYFLGSWAAWDKLYKAKLFDGIRFPEGEINEDEAIVLHLLDRCKTVCYTNEIFYHYMRRTMGTSITTAAFSKKKLIWVKHCRDNLAFIREKYPELEYYAVGRYQSSIVWLLREISLQKSGYEEEWTKLKREMIAEFPRLWKYKNNRRRVLMILFSVFPRSICRMVIEQRSFK